MFAASLGLALALNQPAPAATASPLPAALFAAPATVALNPAQQQIVTISGATAPLTATTGNGLVRLQTDPAGTSVTVTATQATGSDVLHVVDATGAAVDVPIQVAFNAGTIVGQTTLRVTGAPADPAWLAAAAANWTRRLTTALPGAQTYVSTPDVPQALEAGAQTQIAVPVQITSGGGQYFAQSGATTVNVTNVPVDAFTPELLFYDDDPEHVTQDGVLFRATVQPGQPAGLYYYHDDAADPRRIVIVLSAAAPSQVQTIDASAGPNIDVMQVGHAVSRNFLLVEPRREGTIVDVAPDAPFVLHDVAMTARQGVAGKINLRILSGGPVTVTVLAASPGADALAMLDGPRLPGDGHHRTGVFRLAGYGNDAIAYTAGGQDATFTIGDTEPTPPNVDPNAEGRDYGDYGVLHTLGIDLTNPTPAPATAYLFFRPTAGVDRASFLVDGNLIELGCVRVPQPYQIAAFQLAPGQRTRAVVQTMTDGGSFFPAIIGITGNPPVPSAPPVSAPDGCFPKPQS
jgi:hypothetical protein